MPAPAQTTAPQTLTLVHTAGTKYIDYCTDGTKITAYRGEPAIDANLDRPDSPTPNCPNGQKWDHTIGQPGYDTPSGDLDFGQYARQEDGTSIQIRHRVTPSQADTSSTTTP
jgi:hypothetical protein